MEGLRGRQIVWGGGGGVGGGVGESAEFVPCKQSKIQASAAHPMVGSHLLYTELLRAKPAIL